MVSRAALRALCVVTAAAVLASCSSSGPRVKFKQQRSKEYFSERQYGQASPRVVTYGAVPKGGGHVVVGDAYSVAGKTYIPRDNPRYSKTGLASWYGEAFHGRLTANGEVYDVSGLTAAHPTLPLPSYARVTNLENGRSLVVRVNDRGPFAHDRIIDVSAKVADLLDFQAAGTANVKVDYVGPAQMDGLDQRMLLASYRDPNGGLGGAMFVWARPRQQAPVMLAAAPLPRVRPVFAAAFSPPSIASDDPFLLMPAYAPADDDLLAPLIMRSSFVNSYAADEPLSGAQRAVADLAGPDVAKPDLQAALARAAARKAQELGIPPETAAVMTTSVVQLGSFADSANAARVTANFSRFGQVETGQQQSGARTLIVVRVVVDPSVAPSAVLDAASQAGLAGAFVLAR